MYVYTLNFYISVFANVIDRPDVDSVPLDTCSSEADEVLSTIRDIANIGFPTPEVNCSGPGVTVENGTVMVSCGSHMDGDTIRCNATNSLGSGIFFLLFSRPSKFSAAVTLLLCSRLCVRLRLS